MNHKVEVFGGLPGVRTGKRVPAVATCKTCGRVGRAPTRKGAIKKIQHVEDLVHVDVCHSHRGGPCNCYAGRSRDIHNES